MTKRLETLRDVPEIPGVRTRTYEGTDDVSRWLQLRRKAFAREQPGVRDWQALDFEQEFLAKPWWQPDRSWLAEDVAEDESRPLTIGAVTLALRGEGESARPVVHWLCTLPAWRRRGVGNLLMTTLENYAYAAGYRQLWLETHERWASAAMFYRAIGYELAEDCGQSS